LSTTRLISIKHFEQMHLLRDRDLLLERDLLLDRAA
jgi:hypothetical protein